MVTCVFDYLQKFALYNVIFFPASCKTHLHLHNVRYLMSVLTQMALCHCFYGQFETRDTQAVPYSNPPGVLRLNTAVHVDADCSRMNPCSDPSLCILYFPSRGNLLEVTRNFLSLTHPPGCIRMSLALFQLQQDAVKSQFLLIGRLVSG